MLIEANSQYLFCYITEKKIELPHSALSLTSIFKLVIHNFEKHVFQFFANDYMVLMKKRHWRQRLRSQQTQRRIYSVFQKKWCQNRNHNTATNLIRIKYPLSSLIYRLSGANVANFNKIHCTVFEQQLFEKWSSKTEVSNMEKSPYQFVRNTTSYSLCSKWSPFAQTFACLLCRPYVLCCWQISCLQTL